MSRLERAGFVERRPCPSDRRGSNAVLTPLGLKTLTTCAPTHVRGVREHFVDRQQAAMQLSSFLRFDPWTDQVIPMHASFEPVLSPADKMPFEVEPVYLKLSYFTSPVTPDAASTAPTAPPPVAPDAASIPPQ